jgi:hypothetical protein
MPLWSSYGALTTNSQPVAAGCVSLGSLTDSFFQVIFMRIPAVGLGLALCGLLPPDPARAETLFTLTSFSESTRYGVLVVAPEQGCVASRVVIETARGTWRSSTLASGQVAVVRLGHGFATGEHELRVQTAGCRTEAHAARRVVLGKTSPDHGWRATRQN